MENGAWHLSVERLVRFDSEGNLKAYADLTIENLFVIKGLRVVQGKNGLFVSMPRQQGKDGKWYDTVTTLTKETKEEVGRVVLSAYEQDATRLQGAT